jgi:mannose-6-phosphate isomerase
MPTLDLPLLLSPVLKPKIWGRRDLSPLFERPSGLFHPDELIGEAWLTDDQSQFMNGPPAGMTLAEAVKKFGAELCGNSWHEPRFPILAKYIFTSDWLSVQVHPDDDYARLHDPGSLGKCEMWYIVHAGRDARILLGTGRGVSKEALRSSFEKGTSRELLAKHRARPGEAFFVSPGTVHALGPGLVLFEAEEHSDLTYRLDDYGREGLDGKPRPLHLKKGMDVVRLDAQPQKSLPQLKVREAYGSRRYVVASRYFAVEEITMRRRAAFQSSPRRVEILSVLEGEGRIETTAGWMSFTTGETWLIPPATGAYRLIPAGAARFLKVYVPDLDRDFRQPLAHRRISAREIARLVRE